MATMAEVAAAFRANINAAMAPGKTVDADKAEHIVNGLCLQELRTNANPAWMQSYTPEEILSCASDRLLAWLNTHWDVWDTQINTDADQDGVMANVDPDDLDPDNPNSQQ